MGQNNAVMLLRVCLFFFPGLPLKTPLPRRPNLWTPLRYNPPPALPGICPACFPDIHHFTFISAILDTSTQVFWLQAVPGWLWPEVFPGRSWWCSNLSPFRKTCGKFSDIWRFFVFFPAIFTTPPCIFFGSLMNQRCWQMNVFHCSTQMKMGLKVMKICLNTRLQPLGRKRGFTELFFPL